MGFFRLLFRLFAPSRPQPPVLDDMQFPPTPRPWRNYPAASSVTAQSGGQTGVTTVAIQRTTLTVIATAGTVVQGRCWVIDGDTIDIAGHRIRLSGIDAPEMDHPYGKAAKSALIRLCRGHEVRAVFDGVLTHDRGAATCYLPDGRDLSAEMVRAGLAIDWPKYSGGKYRPLEADGLRRKLWRCDARQKGRMPPQKKGHA